MALPTLELELQREQVDGSIAYIDDVSAWGISGAEARNAQANFLCASKNDKNGQITTKLTVVTSDPLNQLEWAIPTLVDGSYQFNLLRIPIFTTGGTYVPEIKDAQGLITQSASIVWYQTSGQVLKAKVAISPGAFNILQWDVVPDLFTLINYASIVTHIHHDLIDVYLRAKLRDKLELCIDTFGTDQFNKSPSYEQTNRIDILLNGANALNADEESDEMEEVIIGLTQYAKLQ